MAKTKTAYYCQSCGLESPKWIGKCPGCNEWNTYVEEVVVKNSDKTPSFREEGTKNTPVSLSEVTLKDLPRIATQNGEFDRVLGGGIVPGSLTLIGGDPGIGKSTLILQIALQNAQRKVLYVSGEESVEQIKMRADRISDINKHTLVYSEVNLNTVLQHAKTIQPDLLVIDSIQTMALDKIESSPGSISQVRECTASILRFAKESNVPVILIGHINKEGSIAGPKVLEHMVDTVLQFEGDKNHLFRILRSVKNRFGSTAELGIFEMRSDGLREITNPSEHLLAETNNGYSGVATAGTIEGIRPILIEVQALVSSAVYGTPQRSATGFDLKRLNMLLAVLEKKVGFKLQQKDVFLNMAGGMKVIDTASDLAIISAVLSSSIDRPIPEKTCLIGEVGLSGELRPVGRIDQRILEAEKLGFAQVVIPERNRKSLPDHYSIKIFSASQVSDAFRYLFKGEE